MAVFPGAVIRKGADELTLRAHEECVLRTSIATSNVGDPRWGPPVVDADLYQAIFQGVDGPEWKAMYYQYNDLRQAVKSKKSGENKKAKVLRAMKEVKDKGVDYHDTNTKKKFRQEPNSG